MKILNTFISGEQLVASGYIGRYADNFGYNHLIKSELARWEKYKPTFYVVEADARINYGLDFQIWISYNADGINFFAQMSLGSSCLSSSALRRVVIDGGKVEFGSQGYSKDQKNRAALRDASVRGWIFG